MKYFTVLICNFLLLFVFLPFISSSQEKLDLFVLAGQSNAQGWMGDGAYYPEEEKELDDSILLNWTFVDNESSDGEWVTMQPQKGRFPKGHFGPEVSFGRELKKAGYNPAIFKYTKGATGLVRDWKALGEGGIYDRMTRDLKFAINKLENHGFEVKVHGFIWIQGETDAGNEQAAKDYYHNLKQLINNFRNNALHKPDLKIILGVDEQHPFVKERPVVVEAQRKLAEEDENIVFSSMMGLPKADATHLTPEGLVKHGKRIFNAYSSKFLDKLLDSENYHKHRNGIRNSQLKFQRAKKGRIAFLGGSITYNGGWRYSIYKSLQQRFPDSNGGLPQSKMTIGKALKQNGYQTAAIGKWHLGHKSPYLPTGHGFDSYFGISYSNNMDKVEKTDHFTLAENERYQAYNVPLMRDKEIIERPADQRTITKRYTAEAVSKIKSLNDRPFFIYLAHSLPHIPLFRSEEFKDVSLAGFYGDVIEEIGWSVGQILKTLKEEGIAENTLVVFTSDNGPWHIFKTHGGSAGLLRGVKGGTFERTHI